MSCPKVIGQETEYGNGIVGLGTAKGQPADPLLRALHGSSAHRGLGKDFLPNGMRAYNDHGHVEICTGETLTPSDFVASAIAADRLLEAARAAAQEDLPPDQQLIVVANNSDSQGNSYACHLNVLMDRTAYTRIFEDRPHLNYEMLLPFLVTIPVITGAGKVGQEGDTPPATFQLSQRADHIVRAVPALQTTYERPLVNTRDEPLSDREKFARWHFTSTFDSNRHPYAIWLKAGTLQLVTAMLENQVLEDRRFLDRPLTLKHPIAALHAVSRDTTLRAEIELEDGRKWTGLQIQTEILAAVKRFVDTTETIEYLVPEAHQIVLEWERILHYLGEFDTTQLMRRLDWVAKFLLIERHAEARGWSDPALKVLDIQYSNINPAQGLFHTVFEKGDLVEQVCSEERVQHLMRWGAEDTRAWLRSALLHRFGQELDSVDWDSVRVRRGSSWWPYYTGIGLPDPLTHTKALAGPILEQVDSIEQLIEAFGPPALKQLSGGEFDQLHFAKTTDSALYLPERN